MDSKIKKTKITQIFRYAYPNIGGIESAIDQINGCLPDEVYEKEVICCSNSEKSSIENNVKFIRCRYFFEIVRNNISLSFIWNLHKVNTDILHFHMPYIFAMIAFFIARPKYKKLYITYHSDIVGFDKYMWMFTRLYKLFIKKTDKIHVHTPDIIENSNMIRPYKDKCVIVPRGISLETNFSQEKVNEIREKYKGKKIIFSLGRLVKYKGFIYGIQAMKNIENAIYLIGGSGPLKEDFEQYIKENKLEEKVVLLGRLSDDDIENYNEACDIYLFPSSGKTEAFGVVQIEAMKHSKPVINTDLKTGTTYVSVDGETGLTVEPANVEQLTNAMNKLLKDDELRLQLGQNARKRVEDLFALNRIKSLYRSTFNV